ncbi:MAG: DUF3047 domain-containing protein [Deltaproteobacteria bacterium]|nr:DUF3047 domain-containing protein [Deltaproteobacteria bacterium]
MKKNKAHHFKSCASAILAAVLLVIIIPNVTEAGNILEIGKFSALLSGQEFPQEWKPLVFKKIKTHTDYRLVVEANKTVVVAKSHGGASGLVRRIQVDLKSYPVIRWRWKVTATYPKGDISKKSGDDLPARIYIMFKYNPDHVGFFERAVYRTMKAFYGAYPPIDAINYVWASHMPVGTIASNPYTSKLKFIVVQSGNRNLGKWITETRNIYEDYKKAFGNEPPMISGIAIMTDTDNTNSSALTYYGDIEFLANRK